MLSLGLLKIEETHVAGIIWPIEDIHLIFAGLLSAVCAVAIFAGVYSVVKDKGDSSGEISWLYSQTAGAGELDEREDGTFHLIFRNVDYHTVQFSDRPDRLVEVIDTADLVRNWDTLFATSSPYAVLQALHTNTHSTTQKSVTHSASPSS